MASIFGHSIVAYTLSKVIDKKNSKILLFLAVLSSIIPDADVIAFRFGIPYEHMFGHRGFTHSIVFALLWSLLLTYIVFKRKRLVCFLILFSSTISHGILDAMTSGGKGVGFFIPFNSERYFFPFREILVSPLGIKNFFSEWGRQVLISEFMYIFLPCLIVLAVVFVVKEYRK